MTKLIAKSARPPFNLSHELPDMEMYELFAHHLL